MNASSSVLACQPILILPNRLLKNPLTKFHLLNERAKRSFGWLRPPRTLRDFDENRELMSRLRNSRKSRHTNSKTRFKLIELNMRRVSSVEIEIQ